MKNENRISFLLPWFICGLGALFYSYEYFLRITPSVMTNDLIRFFHMDEGSLGNLSAFYYYAYTPMQLIAGILLDRYGPRYVLTMASLSCVIGLFIFTATNQLWLADIGRFLMGFGSAFAFVGVLKLMTIWLPVRYFALFSGVAVTLGMLGAITGNLVLTHLIGQVGWQYTMSLSSYFGIFITILIFIFVRDKGYKTIKSPVDLQQVSYNFKKIIKSSQMWIVGIVGGLLYVATSAFAELWSNPYLQIAHKFTHEQAAVAVSLIFAGWAVGSPLAGWISDAIKRRCLPLTINSLIAGFLIAIVLYVPNLTEQEVYILLFIFGIFSGVQATTFAIGREISSPHAAGSAIAFINMVVMLSGVIFQPLIGHILDFLQNDSLNNTIHSFTTADYQIALSVIPISLFISSIMSFFFIKETHCVSDDRCGNEKISTSPSIISIFTP